MKKYFVVADVHSFYEEMIEALSKQGFDPDNPDHVFVSLGDLLDRGPDPVKCLQYVNAIPSDRKILIRGNHEDLLQECLAREVFLGHDLSNGTMDTVMALAGEETAERLKRGERYFFASVRGDRLLVEYYAELRDYAEVGDYLFVHGWLPAGSNDKQSYWLLGNWREARWFNGMEKWWQGARPTGKTVLCGHWHASWGHRVLEGKGSEFGEDADFSPFIQEGIIALDACTALSHKVNCWVLEA